MNDENFQKNDDNRSDNEENDKTQSLSVESDNNEGVDGKNKDDFLESESEEDFVVTIGEIKSNVSFQNKLQNSATNVSSNAVNKLELDSVPNFKGTPIYDLDLASMEDKPWRKPGADITDYFNYGFNEETWNQYCERQKKLRSEYGGNQEAVNRAIFNSISLSGNGPQLSTMVGGRQLVSIVSASEKPKINKVIIDLSKPPPIADTNQSPIIRTIISGSGAVSHNVSDSTRISASPIGSNNNLISLGNSGDMSLAQISTTTVNGGNNNPLMNMTDFSKPPPNASNFSQPPPNASNFSQPPPTQTLDFAKPPPATNGNTAPPSFSCLPLLSIKNECPPGIDEPEPPGVSTPPPGLSSINTMGFNPTLSGFNPSVPPPGVGNTADRIEAVSSMSVPPPSIYNQNQYQPGVNTGSAGFGPPPNFSTRPISLLSTRGSSYNTLPPGTESGGSRNRGYEKDYKEYKEHSSGDSNDESYRRKRRRRSRSGSGERSRRRKDDRDRDRERDYLSRRYDDDSRSSKRKSDRDLNKKRSTARVDEKDISDDRERKRKKHDKDKIIGRSE